MADNITQKHLDKLRVRGAPSIIPGAAGMVGDYAVEEIQRQTVRSLVLELDRDFTVAALRDGQKKLSQLAAVQRLRALEAPVFALHGDPQEDLPHEWTWQLMLPVRGPAKRTDDVSTGRLHGGMYVQTVTDRGFADLRNVYTYLLGDFLPHHKQQLTRPCIYHQVLDGLDSDDPRKLTLTVFVPIQLSLKSPTRLSSRSYSA